jgi:hypothetical protein
MATNELTSVTIDLYGLVIQCKAESPELASELTRPFKYFKTDQGHPNITVIVHETDPPYETFPSIAASFSTPRNIVYKDKGLKIIDYFGKGVVIQDDSRREYRLYGREKNFLQEVFYLLTLSLLGQFCDRNGMLRVHALAFSYHDRAILLTMPQGGGKSTLALAMLQEGKVKYISDDDPLFDRRGRILSFPRPLGISDKGVIKSFPKEYVYHIDRMEFGIKYFIDNDYWKGRLETKPLNDIFLLSGRRILSGTPSIERCSKREILSTLIRDAVIGIGLYQGLEFIINRSTWEVLTKMTTFFKRFYLALKLVRVSKTYRFTLTNNIAQNVCVLKEFVQKIMP